MPTSTPSLAQHQWEQFYNQVSLAEMPAHYANIRNSPYYTEYLTTILKLCPRDRRTLETGIGYGLSAVWLSHRGIRAQGLDYAPGIVERAKQINNLLGGQATFRTGDLFNLFFETGSGLDSRDTKPFQVIHHQGVLEHFTIPQIHAALAQQVALAEWVVFCVPSVYYPYEPEFGDERLLPVEEWQRILAPFHVEELRYHGDPQFGHREHVLCVLRGQEVTEKLVSRMRVPEPAFLPGISAIVHTRNESRHIVECLETLEGWTDERIVCDMESEDDTIALARLFVDEDHIVRHPRIANFDRARNVSAMRAKHQWVFYLDADERVPPALGQALRQLVMQQEDLTNPQDGFEALLIPFRHHFAGQWLKHLYPGYTSPRLFKNGHFVFNTRLHAGARVDGKTASFPADNPDLALVHYSFDSLSHYLTKLNSYTDGEAANMHRDGRPFHWQHALQDFVYDFKSYYDRLGAGQDGVHGFIYSFLSAFYRFEQHAKLYELRYQNGQVTPPETEIPRSVEEILEYALAVCREKPRAAATPIKVEQPSSSEKRNEEDIAPPAQCTVVWSGPLVDRSGYGEESRHLVLALADTLGEGQAEITLAAQILPWGDKPADLSSNQVERLKELSEKSVAPGFIQVIHNFPQSFERDRHSQAGLVIGRTTFETDRLPVEWVKACNRMDYVMVPTEFNRRTFAQSGVAPEKLLVIPECFDTKPYLALPAKVHKQGKSNGKDKRSISSFPFVFLSVFDWMLHKGWDALLRTLLEEFKQNDNVRLILKVWSSNFYSNDEIKRQAVEFTKSELGVDLISFIESGQVQFIFDYLDKDRMLVLYQSADCYVMPSRGEGWGRPFMEAMACGLPTIGTNWSGNTAFMNAENSFLIDCDVVPVPETGWREVPTYKGHRWAEPELESLKRHMRFVVDHPAEAHAVALRGRQTITEDYGYEKVGPLLARELTRLWEQHHQKTAAKVTDEGKSDVSVPATLRVRWEGPQFAWHSLALVNREFCLGLLEGAKHEAPQDVKLSVASQIDISIIPNERQEFGLEEDPRLAPLAARLFASFIVGAADVHVRHHFPPRFDKPEEGRFVLIQPWEYGFLPAAWIDPILRNVDEVWCYSQYVKQVYLASGIPEKMLQVVPLGVDTDVFSPNALPYVFTDEAGATRISHILSTTPAAGRAGSKKEAPFVFLFVGGTIYRKGIDILLEAYQKAFSAYDNVCLVIKDTGVNTVYIGQNYREQILSVAADTSRPPVIYLDADLPPHQMAGLYTAADCLVQPYRGEGFCLPALESMACGRAVIVTAGGPTDDFVDDEVGWRLPSEHKAMGSGPGERTGAVGPWECVGLPWTFEVSPEALGRVMREAYQNREATKAKGEAAAVRVQQGWSWRNATDYALKRLQFLQGSQAAKQLPASVPGHEELPCLSRTTAAGTSQKSKRPTSGRKDGGSSKTDTALATNPTGPIVKAVKVRTAPTISLCMIVRNEERVLGDCLKSVRPWFDEIIVVDTGSCDRTVQIADEHGAKVYHFPWCDDFSAARNESLKYATGEWVMWMDADDTLPEECGRKVHDLALLAEERTTGFLMQVHIPPAPGDYGFTIVDHVKLFRNLPEIRFEGRIHEQILEPIYRIGGRIERSDLYVVHSGYDHSPEGQQKKRERDLTILEKDLADRPNHPFVWFNIGMTAFHLKDFPRAISTLEHCLTISKPQESTVRKVFAMLAGSYLEMGNLAKSKEVLERGLSRFPNDPELLFRAGIIYREVGDLISAEAHYVKLLTSREVGHIDSIDVTMTGYKARHNLALVYMDMGRPMDAEAQWKQAVTESPTFVPSWLGLGDLYLRHQRLEEVRAVVRQLQPLAPEEAHRLEQHIA